MTINRNIIARADALANAAAYANANVLFTCATALEQWAFRPRSCATARQQWLPPARLKISHATAYARAFATAFARAFATDFATANVLFACATALEQWSFRPRSCATARQQCLPRTRLKIFDDGAIAFAGALACAFANANVFFNPCATALEQWAYRPHSGAAHA